MERKLGRGRTTSIDDPSRTTLNVAPYLKLALASHEQLDLVVIMLGKNDAKANLKRTPLEIGLGMGELINIVQKHFFLWNRTEYKVPKVLVISPPPLSKKLCPIVKNILKGGYEKTKKLAKIYKGIATQSGEDFFDVGSVISTDGIDDVHFTAKTKKKFGEAISKEVKKYWKKHDFYNEILINFLSLMM